MNQAVMRAQRFFESEIGNSTLPDTYYKANGGEPDTRSADSRFMLSGAIEPDWSMAQTWEYEQDIVTEVPALLTLPIRYTTLIEERGDTVSLTTQAPHSRLRIIENPETGVMYSFVITLLPDESYGGDPSLLGSHPIESDYWGISVYSKPDGTPLLGYRYENGEFKGSLMFDDNYDDQAISDLLIVIGYDSGPSTRQSVQMELEMMTYRIISVDGRHYLVEENDSYMIGGGGSPVVVQERINRPPDGYYQGNPIWDIPGGNGNPDIQVPGGGGGGSGSGGNGGTTPIDLGITVSVPNGFCVLGSIAAAIQVKFGDNASTAIDKAEAAMNAAGVTVDDINITINGGVMIDRNQMTNILTSLGFSVPNISYTKPNIGIHFTNGGFGIGHFFGPPSHDVFLTGYNSSNNEFSYYDSVTGDDRIGPIDEAILFFK